MGWDIEHQFKYNSNTLLCEVGVPISVFLLAHATMISPDPRPVKVQLQLEDYFFKFQHPLSINSSTIPSCNEMSRALILRSTRIYYKDGQDYAVSMHQLILVGILLKENILEMVE